MKLKTSFFNAALSRSLVRRSWPVWTCYFAVLLMMVPGDLMQIVERSTRYEQTAEHLVRQLNRSMLNGGVNTAILSFVACVLVAMAMYGFMYNNRSTSMYCSLPIKRETVFSTAFLTGLVPMLIADVVIALICLGFFSSQGLDAGNVWLFLAMALLGNIAFYGMAAFCAVLTGHILVLPAVYVVLNVAVNLAEMGVDYGRRTLVYGYSGEYHFEFLSPIVNLANHLNVQNQWHRDELGNMIETGVYTLNGFEWLAVYAVAGLVLAGIGLVIYRRRQMESCGDVVAVRVLKPIFRYCMCFGVALMFAAFAYNALFESFMFGLTEAGCYLALCIVGGFIGYFTAEMLMQKTLRVFRGRWKGFLVSCLVLCVFVGVNEFDLFGYEKRLPAAGEIDNIHISYYDGCDYEQPENIEKILDFHQLLIDEKNINESAGSAQQMTISYEMKDGSFFTRNYPISYEYAQQRDENASINALGRVVNLQEAIDSRVKTIVPVTERAVVDASIEGGRLNENGEYEWFNIELTAAQAAEFYNECIVPDAAAGKLCRLFPVNNEEYYSKVSAVSFHFGIYYDKKDDDWGHSDKSFTLYLDAPRCCEWIEKNTDIELVSIGEVDPEAMEENLYRLRPMDEPVVEATYG